MRLRFELKWGVAVGADIIDGGGVCRRAGKFVRVAVDTVQIFGAPGFRGYASTLRIAFVRFEARARKFESHAGIRSRSVLQINLCFRFDNKDYFDCALRTEGEFAPGVFEGVGGGGVDNFAARRADEIIVSLTANEFRADWPAHICVI